MREIERKARQKMCWKELEKSARERKSESCVKCHNAFSFCISLRHYLYDIDRVLHNIELFCIRALIFSAEYCQRAQIEDMQNGKCQQSQRLRERSLKAPSESSLELSECGKSAHYMTEYTGYHWFNPLWHHELFHQSISTCIYTKKRWRWNKTTAYLHSFMQFLLLLWT